MTKAYRLRHTDASLQIVTSAQNMAVRTQLSPVSIIPLQSQPGDYFAHAIVDAELIGVTQSHKINTFSYYFSKPNKNWGVCAAFRCKSIQFSQFLLFLSLLR